VIGKMTKQKPLMLISKNQLNFSNEYIKKSWRKLYCCFIIITWLDQ